MNKARTEIILVTVSVLLALSVVMLGAYTRLTDAGLGCPDWPGCYGHLVVPKGEHIVQAKAWTEMVHRYLASTLGLLIIGLIGLKLGQGGISRSQKKLAFALIAVVGFQGLLGMWTVTLKLLPLIVSLHLIGGFTVLSLLWWWRLELQSVDSPTKWLPTLVPYARFGLLLVVVQVLLGAWTSTNYAALSCIGLPECNGQWWPTMHWLQAFNLFSPIGVNYEGGVLDAAVRTTIHFTHRIGALVVTLYSLGFIVLLWRQQAKKLAGVLAAVLALQLTLGMLNVLWLLPLPVAVAHNGGAAILLLVWLTVNFRSCRSHA